VTTLHLSISNGNESPLASNDRRRAGLRAGAMTTDARLWHIGGHRSVHDDIIRFYLRQGDDGLIDNVDHGEQSF